MAAKSLEFNKEWIAVELVNSNTHKVFPSIISPTTNEEYVEGEKGGEEFDVRVHISGKEAAVEMMSVGGNRSQLQPPDPKHWRQETTQTGFRFEVNDDSGQVRFPFRSPYEQPVVVHLSVDGRDVGYVHCMDGAKNETVQFSGFAAAQNLSKFYSFKFPSAEEQTPSSKMGTVEVTFKQGKIVGESDVESDPIAKESYHSTHPDGTAMKANVGREKSLQESLAAHPIMKYKTADKVLATVKLRYGTKALLQQRGHIQGQEYVSRNINVTSVFDRAPSLVYSPPESPDFNGSAVDQGSSSSSSSSASSSSSSKPQAQSSGKFHISTDTEQFLGEEHAAPQTQDTENDHSEMDIMSDVLQDYPEPQPSSLTETVHTESTTTTTLPALEQVDRDDTQPTYDAVLSTTPFQSQDDLKQPSQLEASEPKEHEPKEHEPKEHEPKETEPKETEPKEPDPKEADPKEPEPKEPEPKEPEPKEPEPKEPEPKEPEPKEAEPKASEEKVEGEGVKDGSEDMEAPETPKKKKGRKLTASEKRSRKPARSRKTPIKLKQQGQKSKRPKSDEEEDEGDGAAKSNSKHKPSRAESSPKAKAKSKAKPKAKSKAKSKKSRTPKRTRKLPARSSSSGSSSNVSNVSGRQKKRARTQAEITEDEARQFVEKGQKSRTLSDFSWREREKHVPVRFQDSPSPPPQHETKGRDSKRRARERIKEYADDDEEDDDYDGSITRSRASSRARGERQTATIKQPKPMKRTEAQILEEEARRFVEGDDHLGRSLTDFTWGDKPNLLDQHQFHQPQDFSSSPTQSSLYGNQSRQHQSHQHQSRQGHQRQQQQQYFGLKLEDHRSTSKRSRDEREAAALEREARAFVEKGSLGRTMTGVVAESRQRSKRSRISPPNVQMELSDILNDEGGSHQPQQNQQQQNQQQQNQVELSSATQSTPSTGSSSSSGGSAGLLTSAQLEARKLEKEAAGFIGLGVSDKMPEGVSPRRRHKKKKMPDYDYSLTD